MNPLAGEVVVHADGEALARDAAADFAALAREAVDRRGHFTVALTGGSSPGRLYQLLADAPREEIPWNDVHLFWGDDRVVPPDHPRSNYRLAHRLFVGAVHLPPANIHRVRGELGPRRAADLYQAELSDFFAGSPRFDLVHLGLGDDGHVASLFPFDRERLYERERLAVRALYAKMGEWRVTVTYPVLRNARRVEFLLPSAGKASIARTAMHGPLDPVRIPAQGVIPTDGVLRWRLTRAFPSALAQR